MSAQLKAHIWASALLRRAQIGGASAFVMAKGDADAGIVMVKVATLDGKASLYSPERNFDGERVWRQHGPRAEFEIDAYVVKRGKTDPDMWVIEIEDREGRAFLLEDIVND